MSDSISKSGMLDFLENEKMNVYCCDAINQDRKDYGILELAKKLTKKIESGSLDTSPSSEWNACLDAVLECLSPNEAEVILEKISSLRRGESEVEK